MDTDNPNLNDAAKDNRQWWEAVKAEQEARADRLEAEERMRHNDMMNNFNEEVEGAADWTEANWDMFKAKVKQWTNKGEVAADEAV